MSNPIRFLFGCSHQRTTFPQTPKQGINAGNTYVVCLDCGKEMKYTLPEAVTSPQLSRL